MLNDINNLINEYPTCIREKYEISIKSQDLIGLLI